MIIISMIIEAHQEYSSSDLTTTCLCPFIYSNLITLKQKQLQSTHWKHFISQIYNCKNSYHFLRGWIFEYCHICSTKVCVYLCDVVGVDQWIECVSRACLHRSSCAGLLPHLVSHYFTLYIWTCVFWNMVIYGSYCAWSCFLFI